MKWWEKYRKKNQPKVEGSISKQPKNENQNINKNTEPLQKYLRVKS